MSAFRGSFTSALRWHHLDALWELLDTKADNNWFIYAIGEPPPEHPVSGVSCGFSDNPPLPGWVLSRLQPCDLPSTRIVPNNRRRWWKKLFG